MDIKITSCYTIMEATDRTICIASSKSICTVCCNICYFRIVSDSICWIYKLCFVMAGWQEGHPSVIKPVQHSYICWVCHRVRMFFNTFIPQAGHDLTCYPLHEAPLHASQLSRKVYLKSEYGHLYWICAYRSARYNPHYYSCDTLQDASHYFHKN